MCVCVGVCVFEFPSLCVPSVLAHTVTESEGERGRERQKEREGEEKEVTRVSGLVMSQFMVV